MLLQLVHQATAAPRQHGVSSLAFAPGQQNLFLCDFFLAGHDIDSGLICLYQINDYS